MRRVTHTIRPPVLRLSYIVKHVTPTGLLFVALSATAWEMLPHSTDAFVCPSGFSNTAVTDKIQVTPHQCWGAHDLLHPGCQQYIAEQAHIAWEGRGPVKWLDGRDSQVDVNEACLKEVDGGTDYVLDVNVTILWRNLFMSNVVFDYFVPSHDSNAVPVLNNVTYGDGWEAVNDQPSLFDDSTLLTCANDTGKIHRWYKVNGTVSDSELQVH